MHTFPHPQHPHTSLTGYELVCTTTFCIISEFSRRIRCCKLSLGWYVSLCVVQQLTYFFLLSSLPSSSLLSCSINIGASSSYSSYSACPDDSIFRQVSLTYSFAHSSMHLS